MHVVTGIFYSGYSAWWVIVIIVVYLILMFLGRYFIRWSFYVTSQNKLPRIRLGFDDKGFALSQNTKAIGLTFDNAPSEQTDIILDILEKEEVKATFFVTGEKIKGWEAILERMANEGHEIGSHGRTFKKIPDKKKVQDILLELETTNSEIEAIIHKEVRLFRPPYGRTSPVLARALRQTDLTSVGWDSGAIEMKNASEKLLVKKLKKNLKARAVIEFEDPDIRTAKILPQFISDARTKGFDFVTP